MGANTSRDVLDALRRIVQGLRESSRAAERDLGLSGARLFVLRTLAELPGLSLNELAARTRTHQSSVSVVAAALVRAGLVRRRTSPSDRRRAEFWLTARGEQRLAGTRATAQERLVAAVDGLSARERAHLAAILARLADRMVLPERPEMFFETTRRRQRRQGAHTTT